MYRYMNTEEAAESQTEKLLNPFSVIVEEKHWE